MSFTTVSLQNTYALNRKVKRTFRSTKLPPALDLHASNAWNAFSKWRKAYPCTNGANIQGRGMGDE